MQVRKWLAVDRTVFSWKASSIPTMKRGVSFLRPLSSVGRRLTDLFEFQQGKGALYESASPFTGRQRPIDGDCEQQDGHGPL